MLRIWGRINSVNVKKVLWAADELGLNYERTDAGGQFGVTKTPEYMKMNPNSLVPTIEDDGFVLWESHSIVRYFAARHGRGRLWPEDPQARADAERWMDWAFTFQGAVRNAFWGLIRTPPEKRNAAEIEEARLKSNQLIAVPEATLAKQKYLHGNEFSMADIPLGCEVQRWIRLPIERPRMPAVEAWFERLCQRPAFAKNVDIALS